MITIKSGLGLGVALLALGAGVFIGLRFVGQPLAAQPSTATNTAPTSGGPAIPPPPALPANYVGGHIQFATNTLNFGRIKSGDAVKVEYIFTNTDASQPLGVRDVQAGCHCTVVLDWTQRVEPGQTGRILLQYNSDQQPSMPVYRVISVATSDRLQPLAQLILTGTVWKPIDVIPMYAVFDILPDATNGTASLRITNNLSELVYPSPPLSSNPQFAAELKTNFPGKEYLLVVHTVGPLPPGIYSSQFTVTTSTTNAPAVIVWASARVIPAFDLKPAQIQVPPGPLASPFATNVTIQNNSTNPGVLSGPVLNIQGGAVQLRELSPGRLWLAAITIPVGFQETPQTAAFTVNTTHPLSPVIRVPIYQQPRLSGPAPLPSPPPQPTPASASAPPAASTASPLLRSQPTPAYVPVIPATNR